MLSRAEAQSEGSARSEVLTKFLEYKSQDRAAGFLDMPDEGREIAKKKAFALRDELLANEKLTVDELITAFKNSEIRRGQQVDIINFFSTVKIGSNEMLPIVRQIVQEADLNDDPAPLLSASATYLYDFGDKSDIELLERLKGHINPAFASLAEFGIKKLEQGESPQQPPPSSLQAEGVQENKGPVNGESSPQELEKNAESNSPIWPFVVGAIALLGVVIILLRLPKRGG